MNSNDPLFKNYMALYLSIVSKHSVTQSLVEMGILGRYSRKRRLTWDDLEDDYEPIEDITDDDETI